MTEQEHLEQLFDQQYHSDIKSGINRAQEEVNIEFGRAANKINISFQEIKPYLDSIKYKIGSSGRRQLIEAFVCDEKEMFDSLKLMAEKNKQS